MNRFVLTFVLATFSIASSGCGSGAKIEKVVPASGVLKFQGKPLEGYKLTFEPSGERQSATAISDADGKFVLGTNRPGDGAATGKHKVAIVFISEKVEGEPGREVFKTISPKYKVPKNYEDSKASGLEIEIPTSGTSSLDIDLK